MQRKYLRQKYNRHRYGTASHSARQMANEIPECQLNEESKEMAVSIAGYVANTLSSRSECNQFKEKLIFTNKDNGHDHDKYLRLFLVEV